MRWVALALICSAIASFFIVAVYFPRVLNDYPSLRPYVFKVQRFLGMQVHDPTYFNDMLMNKAEKFLEKESEMEKHMKVCGEQPNSPWAGNAVPSDDDIDRYLARKKGWELCVQQQEMKGLKEEIKSTIRPPDSEGKLMEYVE